MRPLLVLWPAALSISIASFLAFKIMSFYVVPVSLLLGLLLACHPIGVLIGRRYYEGETTRAVRHYIMILLATAVFFAATPHLMEGYFDLPRKTGSAAHLLGYLAAAGLLLIPLYGASGIVEYSILRTADKAEQDLRHFAYGGLLLATLGGICLGYLLLPIIGVLGLFLLAVTLALPAANESTAFKASLVATVIASLLTLDSPAFDAAIVTAVSPRSDGTTASELSRGSRALWAGWGKYSYVEIVESPNGQTVSGAYNGSMFWSASKNIHGQEPTQYAIDRAVMDLLDESGRLAIIGSGGGKQVQVALDSNRKLKVDAFELEPAVVDVFTRKHPDANDRAYLADGVSVFAQEGRAGVRKEAGKYDAIYIADAGSFFNYYRTALNFVFFLHTRDAYTDYASALSSRGFVASLIMKEFDVGVSQRVINIFHDIGMDTLVVENKKFSLIIGAKPDRIAVLTPRLLQIARDRGLEQPRPGVSDLTLENPVPTDDRGGLYIFSLYPERTLRGFFFGSLVAFALAVILLAYFSSRPTSPEWLRTMPTLRLIQFILLGTNFVLLENAIILQLAKVTLNISDAVIFGTAAFLVPAVTGAWFGERLVTNRSLGIPLLLLSTAVCMGGLHLNLATTPLLAAEMVLFALTGAFFPAVLRASDRRALPMAFAADSVGACLGTAIIFFVPILFGIRTLVFASFVSSAAAGTWILYTARRVA